MSSMVCSDRMIELTEIMRQKDDQPFVNLLNRFRTASQTEDDMKVIKLRFVSPTYKLSITCITCLC